jgi:hypothetical protein
MRVLELGRSGSVDELAFAPDSRELAAAVGTRGAFVQHLAGSGPPVQARPLQRKGRPRPRAKGLVYLADSRVSFLADCNRYEADPAGCRPAPLPGTEDEQLLEQAGCGRWLVVTMVERPDWVTQKFARHSGWVPAAGAGWTKVWEHAPSVGLGHPPTIGAGPGTETDRFFLVEHPHREDLERTDIVCRSAATGEVLDRTRNPGSFHRLVAAAGGSAVVGVGNEELVVWRPGGGAWMVRCEVRKHFTWGAFHPSGAYLALTHTDGAVRLYDAETWRVVRQHDWGVGSLRCVAFSPDGLLGAAGGVGAQVVVWDCD